MAAKIVKQESTVGQGAYGFQEAALSVENIPIFQTDTHLYVKRTTVLDALRKTIDVPSDKKNTAQLMFEAVCQEQSVDLIFTERLRGRLQSHASMLRAKFNLHKDVDWSCQVGASEFVCREEFETRCGDKSDILDVSKEEVNDAQQTDFNSNLLTESVAASGQQTIAVYVSYLKILDIVRKNLHMSLKDVAKLVFEAMCEENSVQLNCTPRLEDEILTQISSIRNDLVNEDGTAVEWLCKVLVSEFVIPEQFQQVCRKAMYRKPQQAILNELNKMLNLQERRTLRKRRKSAGKAQSDKDTSIGNGRSRRNLTDVDSAVATRGHSHCFLKIPQITVLNVIKASPELLPSQLELLVFKAICQEASVTLVHTPRLQGVVQQFTSKLGSKFKEVSRNDMIPEYTKLIEDSPPWMVTVVASEFVHEEQFQRTRREAQGSKLHPSGSLNRKRRQTKGKRAHSRVGRYCRKRQKSPSMDDDDDIQIIATVTMANSSPDSPEGGISDKHDESTASAESPQEKSPSVKGDSIEDQVNDYKPMATMSVKGDSNEDQADCRLTAAMSPQSEKRSRQPREPAPGEKPAPEEPTPASIAPDEPAPASIAPQVTKPSSPNILSHIQKQSISMMSIMSKEPQINASANNPNSSKTGYTHSKKKQRLCNQYQYRCACCSRHFRTKTDMQTHIWAQRYQGKRPKPQDQKGGSNRTVLTLLGYAETHFWHCGKRFASKEHLKHHKWIMHEMGLSSFQCKYCGMYSDSMQRLKKHIWRHEMKYKRIWVARRVRNIRKASARNQGSLDQLGSEMHADIMILPPDAFKCDYCAKTFSAQFQVDLHSLWHVNYVCCFCGAAFVHKDVLYEHTKSHPTLDLLQCNCHMLWSNPQHIQILGFLHARGMTDDICRSCGHGFGHATDEERHRVCREMMNYVYLCCFCHIVVAGPKSLEEHKMTNHSDMYPCLPLLPSYAQLAREAFAQVDATFDMLPSTSATRDSNYGWATMTNTGLGSDTKLRPIYPGDGQHIGPVLSDE